MDEVLHALTAANSGLPPVGATYDGGTVNSMLHQVFVGMRDMTELQDCKFFSKCTVGRISLPYVPYGFLEYHDKPDSKHVLIGGMDTRHCVKRMVAHANVGTRTIYWGACFTDLSTMVPQGLSLKAYTQHDEQSDAGAWAVLNPQNLPPALNGLATGAHLLGLVVSLLTSGSEGGADLSPGLRFLHAITAYYLLILNVHNAVQKRGRLQWEEAFLPLTTVRNASLNCMQVMWVALFADGSMRPEVFAEQQQERHYGRIKSFFRGMPSIRDGVMGTQKLHLQQMRQRHADPTHPGNTISAATAQDIAREAWKIACRIQSWIVPGRTPDAIAEDGLTFCHP
jgi:hypothetical protein